MIWRGPWDGRWDGVWEGEDQPLAPGFIRGSATVRLTAAGSAAAIGHLSGAADVVLGGSGALGVPPPEGFISGAATISLGASGRLIDPDAVPETRPGGGGSRRRARQPVVDPEEEEILELVSLLVTSGILEPNRISL